MKRLLSLLTLTVLAFLQAPSQTTPPHSVKLTWNAPVGGGPVTGYNLKRSTTAGGPYLPGCATNCVAIPAPTVTYTDPFQLTDEGKVFFYVVTATGPGGESSASNETKATIPFSLPGVPLGLTSVVN